MSATHDTLVDFMVSSDLAMEPAEFHGTILGVLSALPNHAHDASLALLVEECPEPPNDEKIDALSALMNTWRDVLHDGAFETDLLPDWEALPQLEERLEAMAAFARGYLFGIGISRNDDILLQDAQLSEILDDVAAISQVGLGQDDEFSESEQASAFREILEYMKVVPHMVFTTIANHERNASTEKKETDGDE